MSETIPPDDSRPSRADADDVAEAAVGVDTRIFITIWDTLIHTPRVLQAAFDGDRERYIPILRLFLILFGLQFAIVAFIGLPQAMTLDQFAEPDNADTMTAWLAGLDYDAVNQTLERTANLSNTALVFLGSLPYLLLLKLYRPKRSFFGHLLGYLLVTNASYLVMLPLLLPGAFGEFWLWYIVSMVIGILVYFIAFGRILYAHYTSNGWLVALQLLGMVMLLPVTLILVAVSQFALAELAVQIFHDRSFLQLFALTAEARNS